MPLAKGIPYTMVVSGHPVQEYEAIIEDDFVSTYVIAEAHERFYMSVGYQDSSIRRG